MTDMQMPTSLPNDFFWRQSGHSLECRDQAKPNYIAISIHMRWQVYSEWRAIGASLRI
jgi:hypothetical protein